MSARSGSWSRKKLLRPGERGLSSRRQVSQTSSPYTELLHKSEDMLVDEDGIRKVLTSVRREEERFVPQPIPWAVGPLFLLRVDYLGSSQVDPQVKIWNTNEEFAGRELDSNVRDAHEFGYQGRGC